MFDRASPKRLSGTDNVIKLQYNFKYTQHSLLQTQENR